MCCSWHEAGPGATSRPRFVRHLSRDEQAYGTRATVAGAGAAVNWPCVAGR
jgi:hypothetical protein